MVEILDIQNYRNIGSLKSHLDGQANVLIAPNSSGKTNVLEAIHFMVFGTSFKPLKHNSEVIGKNGEYAKVLAYWNNYNLELVVSDVNSVIHRKFSIDQKRTPVKKIITKFPVLVFAPNSVDLISGEPGIRRQDLDEFLSIISPIYKDSIDRYKIILRNRNALLRQIREGRSGKSELIFWTDELVKSADKIFKFRKDFFLSLQDFVTQTAKSLEIFFKDNLYRNLKLIYEPNIDVREDIFTEVLLQKFAANQDKEIIVGKTLYGVHKDNYFLALNDQNMRYFGSRGQQRLATFLLKVAQLTYYTKQHDTYPLFLIDDLMSELDREHRIKLAEFLMKQQYQFLLTSAERFEVPDFLLDDANVIAFGGE